MNSTPIPSSAAALRRLRDAWALADEELAHVFDIGAGEVGGWLVSGVPATHESQLRDMVAGTDALESRLRPGRVAEVVRRPAAVLGGLSLLQLALAHRHAEVHAAVEKVFDIRRV